MPRVAPEYVEKYIRKITAADGSVSYECQIRRAGRKPYFATRHSLKAARSWVNGTLADIDRGVDRPNEASTKKTLAQAIDRYTKEVKRGVEDSRRTWWKEQLGHYSLAQLDSGVISDKISELIAGQFARSQSPDAKVFDRSPSTVNRYIRALGPVLKKCVVWRWLRASPMAGVEMCKEGAGRTRYLTPAERDKLLDACRTSSSPILHTVVLLALATGARRGEIMSLRWAQIDLNVGTAILTRTKNGEHRMLTIRGDALTALKEMRRIPRIDTDLVFPSQKDAQQPANIETAFQAATKAAELADFKFHDLRHTCASYLAMDGATINEIAQVLGHKSLAVTMRYAHLCKSHVSGVVQRMVDRMEGRVS